MGTWRLRCCPLSARNAPGLFGAGLLLSLVKPTKGYEMTRAYGWADDGMTVVEAEAEVLRRVAAWLLAGDSLRAAASKLNEEGVTTVTGKPWSAVVVKRSLSNPRIIGKQRVFDKLVPAEAGPILTPQTFRAVEKAIAALSRAGQPRRVDLLGGGIARCGLCEARLYALVTSARAGYACMTRSGGCGKVWIEAHMIEQDAGEKIVDFLAENSDAVSAAASVELSTDVFSFASWWAAAPKRRQRDVLEAVVARVVVNPTEKRGRGSGIDDGRVVYEWRRDPDFPEWGAVAAALLPSMAVPA